MDNVPTDSAQRAERTAAHTRPLTRTLDQIACEAALLQTHLCWRTGQGLHKPVAADDTMTRFSVTPTVDPTRDYTAEATRDSVLATAIVVVNAEIATPAGVRSIRHGVPPRPHGDEHVQPHTRPLA